MKVLIRPPGVADVSYSVGQRVQLDESETHHLRVRRARDRERVEVLDGAGLVGVGRLIQSGRQWQVEIDRTARQDRPAELTLAVAAGDRDRFSWLVEKSVELGVTRIIPIETSLSAGVATRLKESHLRRLRRLTLEAIKQCGAAWAPSVEEPISLPAFLSRAEPGARWLADAAGESPPPVLNHTPVTVVVGPEGGFTESERAALIQSAYLPISLGPHTLRFETAALAAAAAVTQARLRGQHA
jgi:16S rRNA (uracil1498-N3)-methyltransferase